LFGQVQKLHYAAHPCYNAGLLFAFSSHTVTVTESMLKDMVDHSLVVQFWDNKEKCSNLARSDKPKTFKMPHDKPGNNCLMCMLDNETRLVFYRIISVLNDWLLYPLVL